VYILQQNVKLSQPQVIKLSFT